MKTIKNLLISLIILVSWASLFLLPYIDLKKSPEAFLLQETALDLQPL
jgi:hypothetical protein